MLVKKRRHKPAVQNSSHPYINNNSILCLGSLIGRPHSYPNQGISHSQSKETYIPLHKDWAVKEPWELDLLLCLAQLLDGPALVDGPEPAWQLHESFLCVLCLRCQTCTMHSIQRQYWADTNHARHKSRKSTVAYVGRLGTMRVISFTRRRMKWDWFFLAS